MAVLCADCLGSTWRSFHYPKASELLVEVLNWLGDSLRGHGGRPFQFEGDCIKAVFVPEGRRLEGQTADLAGAAQRALDAAFAVNQAIKYLRHLKVKALPRQFGVSIVSGPCFIGQEVVDNLESGRKEVRLNLQGDPLAVGRRFVTHANANGFRLVVTKDVQEALQQGRPARSLHFSSYDVHGMRGLGVQTVVRVTQQYVKRRKER